MGDKVKIAIVGAGPGGLSAAARAANHGVSHVLLEASAHMANTVHSFQKGKLVMSEPAQLPLRSVLPFAADTRENILSAWRQALADHQVHLRTAAAVSAITGQRGDFRITLSSGEQLEAEHVVLAIGLQGNIRKLNVPGDDLPGIQYQLDDPAAYAGERILVIGGGDAGVENALALAQQNQVILLNRQEDFTNCREINAQRLKESVMAGRLETRTSITVQRIEAAEQGAFPLSLVIQSPQGTQRLQCHRIIARLGAMPPRQMLEGFGVCFPDSDATSVPELSEQYESNVPGMYIIGSLAGYPLIKQALNQGYEVVEHILGLPVEPADEMLLKDKFARIAGLTSVAAGIELIRNCQPLFASLTNLQLREFMLESEILVPHPGEVIFRRNDYGNSFFSVLQGSVDIHVERPDGEQKRFTLSNRNFFGEIGLLSGRRRTATVIAGNDCVLLETSRRSMLKLLDSAPGVQRRLDEVSLKRTVGDCCDAALTADQLEQLVQGAQWKRYPLGEVIFNEGDEADALYLIRKGSVTVSRQVDGKEVVLAYVTAGNYFGELALVSKAPRTATVRAAAPTEVVLLAADRFSALLEQNVSVRGAMVSRSLDRVRSDAAVVSGKNSQLVKFLIDQGAGEATDILLIDHSRCIHCDNCETACSSVHGGASRLSRNAGQTFELIHVPASCRHCEHPHCTKDCPPDAIHRALSGEVFIDDKCIGCGNCQSNCPYGVIQMVGNEDYQPPGLLQLIFGMRKPAHRGNGDDGAAAKRAVKCDMCRGIVGGAACVRACPTGAAFRVSPEQFMAIASR